VSVILAPEARFQLGPLFAGYKLFNYAAGTLIKQNTFTDTGGATPNLNPIILDANGSASMYYTAGLLYKQVLALPTDTDPPTNPIWTQDNVDGIAGSSQNTFWLGVASTPVPIALTPVGNAIATNSVLAINSTTASASTREFAGQIGMVATTGATRPNDGTGDKTSLYVGMIGQPGGGNIWALNPLTTIASGWTGETGGVGQTAQVAEFDLNNNNTDYGNSTGTTYGNPSATGIIITGAGTKFCTAAIQVAGNIGAGAMWRFGIWFGNLSIQNATIADTTNSVTSYVVNGAHTYGIDFNTGTYSGAPIRLGNAQFIKSRNSGGTADLPLLGTAGNNITLGDATVGGIFCSSILVPSTTNNTALGQSANVWSIVWAQQLLATSAAQNNGAGTFTYGATTASTIGAAGAASALPANPLGYVIVNVAGTQAKIPYYNP
jgi:hypothetical protein